MRVFITGATGWIGSAAVEEFLAARHEVVGLARSDASAKSLETKGAHVRRGDLDDLDSIRAGAADADAVVHLANKHDWANPQVSNQAERDAVAAICDVLAGSNRPFVLASGVVGLAQGRAATEHDRSPFHGLDSPRGGSENLALGSVERGVGTVSVRFAPTVHGEGDTGFMAALVAIARDKGVAGYIGDGTSRWSAVHRSDAGRVIRLGLEKAPAGAVLHAVGEQGVPSREIAEAIGRSLNVPVASIAPENAFGHFGWLSTFFALDVPADSMITQQMLGWSPTGPTLIEDLNAGFYFRA